MRPAADPSGLKLITIWLRRRLVIQASMATPAQEEPEPLIAVYELATAGLPPAARPTAASARAVAARTAARTRKARPGVMMSSRRSGSNRPGPGVPGRAGRRSSA